jgi:hypothetical protein
MATNQTPFDGTDITESQLLGTHVYRRSRPSASGLDPEGEGRKLG